MAKGSGCRSNTGTSGPWVGTIIPYDDGTGPALYAGGNFEVGGLWLSSKFARWAPQRPGISFSQMGPGAPLFVTNTRLVPGHVYHAIVSLEPCIPLGSGPYGGLCATDPSPLVAQFGLPLGTLPFHFVQSEAARSSVHTPCPRESPSTQSA